MMERYVPCTGENRRCFQHGGTELPHAPDQNNDQDQSFRDSMRRKSEKPYGGNSHPYSQVEKHQLAQSLAQENIKPLGRGQNPVANEHERTASAQKKFWEAEAPQRVENFEQGQNSIPVRISTPEIIQQTKPRILNLEKTVRELDDPVNGKSKKLDDRLLTLVKKQTDPGRKQAYQRILDEYRIGYKNIVDTLKSKREEQRTDPSGFTPEQRLHAMEVSSRYVPHLEQATEQLRQFIAKWEEKANALSLGAYRTEADAWKSNPDKLRQRIGTLSKQGSDLWKNPENRTNGAIRELLAEKTELALTLAAQTKTPRDMRDALETTHAEYKYLQQKGENIARQEELMRNIQKASNMVDYRIAADASLYQLELKTELSRVLDNIFLDGNRTLAAVMAEGKALNKTGEKNTPRYRELLKLHRDLTA